MKWNRKWNVTYSVLEKQTLCFGSYKNLKLKVKLWWVAAREKKRAFFVYFVWREFFLTFVIYLIVQCIEYTFRIYILLHIKKHYFMHFCCLFLKSSKAFIVSLNRNPWWHSPEPQELIDWRFLSHLKFKSITIRNTKPLRFFSKNLMINP